MCGKTVEEEVNFPAGLSKKSNFLLDSAAQKSGWLPMLLLAEA
jgi:hypothetical protein